MRRIAIVILVAVAAALAAPTAIADSSSTVIAPVSSHGDGECPLSAPAL